MKIKSYASWYQISPFIAFIGLFLLLHLLFLNAPMESKTGFAHFSCILALSFSMLTFPRSMTYNDRIEIFVRGAAQPTVVHMMCIFVISSVFTHFVTKNGGVTAAVNLGLQVIPRYAILPGLFITVSLFAIIIGTSMGAIAAFSPIALGFAHKLNINPSLAAAIVVSASLLGDNLSLISDSTIAATHITQCKMIDKFKENGLLVLIAAAITIFILTIVNVTGSYAPTTILPNTFGLLDIVNIIPYIVVLMLALFGLDVLYVLTVSTACAVIIGLAQKSYSFLEATTYTFEGFYAQSEVVNVCILIIMVTGLAHIIEYNGGFHFIIAKWEHKIKSSKSAEFVIASLTSVITSAIAINTIAILIVGPIGKRLGIKFGLSKARVASLLDIFSCIFQGLIPYSPHLLLVSALMHTPITSLYQHLYYQYIMFISTVVSMLWKTRTLRNSSATIASNDTFYLREKRYEYHAQYSIFEKTGSQHTIASTYKADQEYQEFESQLTLDHFRTCQDQMNFLAAQKPSSSEKQTSPSHQAPYNFPLDIPVQNNLPNATFDHQDHENQA